MPGLSLNFRKTRLSFTTRQYTQRWHTPCRPHPRVGGNAELIFLSLLGLVQVARAAVFQRFREQSSYDSIDSTNIWTVAAVLTACLWLVWSGATKTVRRQTQTPLRWYAIYLAYAGVSILWSGRILYGSFRVLELAVNLVLMLRIMELLGNQQRALKYLVWSAGTISLLALFGVWKTHGLCFWFHSNDVPMAGGLCTVLCLGSYLTGALSLKAVVLPAVPGLLALVGGTSAGSNVAVAASVSVLLLSPVKKPRPSARRMTFAGIVLLGLALSSNPEQRLKELLFPGKDDAGIRTATGRTVFWQDYLQMVANNPFFGSGFPTGEKEVTVGYFAGSGTTGSTHNMVISLLVNTGIIGLTLYSLWLTGSLLSLWKGTRDPRTCAEALSLLACLILGMINSLTLPVLGSHWFFPIMILYGIVAYAAIYCQAGKQASNARMLSSFDTAGQRPFSKLRFNSFPTTMSIREEGESGHRA